MTSQKIVFDRIAMLRYLMIVGIVILHTPPYVPVTEMGPGLFDFIKAFFQSAVFRATVPVLTVISGYLLFQSGLDQHWMRLARKKTRTIIVPFLVFNLIVLAGAFGAQSMFGLSMSYQLLPFDLHTWIDATFGFKNSPINYPLNFLRDLIVLMALSPLIGIVLRRMPWVGFIGVILIFFNNLDGILVLRDVMPIMFYFGGMAAIRKWDMLALDRYATSCLAAFLVLCVCLVYYRIGNTTYFRYIAPFLIWPAASLLHSTRVGDWLKSQSKISFFIFLAHAPLLIVLSVVYQRLGNGIPYPLYWLAVPIIIIVILSLLYHAFMRFCPRLFAPIIGADPDAGRGRAPRAGMPARVAS